MRLPAFLMACAAAVGSAAAGERIVSTGGTITEIVCALGQSDRLVGIDTSSVYPAEIADLPKVGYARSLSAEGILSLDPGIVLAGEHAGPPAVLDQLRAIGVRIVEVPGDDTVAGAAQRIRAVGEAIGKADEAETLASEVEGALADVARPPKNGGGPRVLFVYARAGGVLNVAGQKTGAEEMIRLAGALNAAEGFEGYRPLTAEAAVAAAPDVILLTARGLETSGGIDGVLAQPGLAATPAGQNHRVVAMDDLLLLGFGPRLPEAVRELEGILANAMPESSCPAQISARAVTR